MESCIGFSHICGENVRVSEGRCDASWDQQYSGGILFSDRPLRPTDSQVRLELDGSSHVDIGITQTNPSSLRKPEEVRQLYRSDKCKIINNIRVHRKTCEAFLQNMGNKVISPYGEKTFGVSVDSKEGAWLVVCIKFGNATVTLDPPFKFHDVTGENIELEEPGKQKAQLKVFNPASICVIDRKFSGKGDHARIQIDPILHNDGKSPNIYHVTLGVTTARPEDFGTLDPQSLSISRTPSRRSQSRWSPIKVFERRNTQPADFGNVIDNCKGELSIDVTSEGELRYTHSSGIEGKWEMKGPLYIVLELFRVSVKLLNKQGNPGYAKQLKGPNAFQLEFPTSSLIPDNQISSPSNQTRINPVQDDQYISPIEDPLPSPIPSRSSPCESSWHESPKHVYASLVLQKLSSLDADAVAEHPQNFERKISDTIREMGRMTLVDRVRPISQPAGELQSPTFLPSGTTMDSYQDMLSQIHSKLEHLEKNISQLKHIEKENHEKMYESYQALKEIVDGIIKQNTVHELVSLKSTIQANYCDLLKKLEPRGLIYKLYEKEVITLPEKQMLVEMRDKGSKEDLNDKLLDCLGSRTVSRSKMIEALQYTNQLHLKDKILPSDPQ